MNTDYGNYSKDLAKVREDYSNKGQKLKKSYDESLINEVNTHEQKEKDSKILNEHRRQELIDQNQDELASLNEKSSKAINSKQKAFMKTLHENNDNFSHERKIMKEQLENKLDRAKNAFSQSLTQIKDSNEVQSKEKEKNFANTLSNSRSNSEQKIQDVEKNTAELFSDFKNNVAHQKRDTNQKHISELNDQYRRLRGDTEEKTEHLNNKINEINKNNALETERHAEKETQVLARHRGEAKENLENLENKYKLRNQDVVNDFQNKFTTLEDQSNDKLEKLKYQATQERAAQQKAKDIGLGKNANNQEKEEQQLVGKENYERRLGSLRKQMTDQNEIYSRRSSEANIEALNKLKLSEDDSKNKILNNNIEHHNDYEKLKLADKENADKNHSEYNKKIGDLQTQTELKIDKAQNSSKEMLGRKQLIHNNEVKQIADLNLENIEYLKNEAKKERTAIKTNAFKTLNDNVSEVKKSYQNKFDKTLEGYQKKFEDQNKVIEKIQDDSNDKIIEAETKSERKVEIALDRERSEREIEKNEFIERYTQLKDAYEEKFKNQKKDFDKEIGRTRKENTMTVTSLIKKNNEEVKNLMESHGREIKRANEEIRKVKEHSFKTANADKANIVEHYENKIEEIKSAYDTEKIKTSENKRSERA